MSFKSSDKLPNRRHLSQLNKSADEAEMAFNAMRVIVISLICLSLCVILSLCGCTKAQRALFRDGVVTVSDCAFYTSIGCASQAAAGCNSPELPGQGYGEFGQCLVNRSSSCAGRGLGLCLLKGIASVVGTTSVVAGGVGCTGDESLQEVRSCVADVTLETESDAVQAVAACYRRACIGVEY